ncbi:hypothetical protein [Novosphingobium profundi]|nr:hypothetical protein [Novosphingobium profundi]
MPRFPVAAPNRPTLSAHPARIGKVDRPACAGTLAPVARTGGQVHG